MEEATYDDRQQLYVFESVRSTPFVAIQKMSYMFSEITFYSTSPNTPQLAAGMKAKVEPYEAQTRNKV